MTNEIVTISDIQKIFPPECSYFAVTEEAKIFTQDFRDELGTYMKGRKPEGGEEISIAGTRVLLEVDTSDFPTIRRYPKELERTLSTGVTLRLTVYPMWFSVRNLMALCMVPEEEILRANQEKRNILVILTSPKLEYPDECLYVYARHTDLGPFVVQYDCERMHAGTWQLEEVTHDLNVAKFLFIDPDCAEGQIQS